MHRDTLERLRAARVVHGDEKSPDSEERLLKAVDEALAEEDMRAKRGGGDSR